ncbi:hypothetical protein KSP40_PGU017231 [Platanthera guangdongensis]|uniref:Target of Myb protein 1 n=1 Tax=Platanthera guangdongensis TaxID=2320717 RepID=A0ABR2M9Q1_9ASPA
MDKTKLVALGERLKIGGERLKVGSAEMGRKFSGKMKEILQGQSQEAKMVEEATSESLEEPNWGLNLRICNFLNSEEFDGTEVVRAIKKKIASKSPIGQLLSLELLETCTMNCEKVFSVVASEKVLEEMVKMIDNPQTKHGNKLRVLQLIEAWGKSDDLSYLPVFKQTYMNLKSREVPTQPTQQRDGSSAPLFYSPDEEFGERGSVPGEYALPRSGQQDAVEDSGTFQGMLLSTEQKRELLVITKNSLEIISSLLNSETKEETIKDELLVSMAENCRESQPVLQRIIETAGEDESMLFEALNLHDELEQVLNNYANLESSHARSTEDQNLALSGEREHGRDTAEVVDDHKGIEKGE